MNNTNRLIERIMDRMEKENEELKKGNERLKLRIKHLNDIIASKNRVINRLQDDAWDDVTYDRER